MDKHWVEDLFPPHFTYTLEEESGESPEKSGLTTAQDGAADDDRDLKRIRKIYDRVRIELNRREKEAQQKCIQVGEPLAEHLPETSPADRSSLLKKKEDVNECLWTSKELEILRRATEEAKQENIRLKAELSITAKQIKKLSHKCKRQTAALTAREAELLERKQETERLSHRCHHLETESRHSRITTRLLEEDVKDLQESKRNLKKQLKSAQKELSDEKLSKMKLDGELRQIGKKLALESTAKENEIRLDYERQIKILYGELEELRVELEKEKKENVSVRKALDHLRIHFARFPTPERRSKSRSDNDALGKLDLY